MTVTRFSAAGLVALPLLLAPARALAATTADCPPATVVPESPAGTVLLVLVAAAGLGVFAYRRRRRGLSATIASTLAVVVLAGALLSTVLASAATSSCPGGGTSPSGQNVGAAGNSTTPLTGADIPWITAGVLIVAGTAVTVASSARRRRQG